MKADFEGWLEKKGDKGPIKLFAKRYFRLYKNENLLCYFKTDKNFKQLGAISLTGILLCEKTKEKTGFNIVMKVRPITDTDRFKESKLFSKFRLAPVFIVCKLRMMPLEPHGWTRFNLSSSRTALLLNWAKVRKSDLCFV